MKCKNFFSTEAREGAFFRKMDWSAFWTATVVSFLVYFFTLGPSVTLEDCGELAVAGDWLGVPHPPGYPIWTICAYLFSRAFSWVTYQGQPTPAWAISLMSSVFGSLAAGLTAMLITRSVSDLLQHRNAGAGVTQENTPGEYDSVAGGDAGIAGTSENSALFCWTGGVAGSLCFAFSPVMWSQATIVEVYTLNAFFLMWIFLLTYRWMRKPSDKILWLTAFVFGLGLTNYQVLLLAAVPLVVVVFLRNIALFRDFLLVGIPVLLTAHVLQIGAEMGAQPGMAGPAYAKMPPLMTASVPSMTMLVAAAVFVLLAVLSAAFSRMMTARKEASVTSGCAICRLFGLHKEKPCAICRLLMEKGATIAMVLGCFGGVLLLLSSGSSNEVSLSANDAPLMKPSVYTSVAALLAFIFASCAAGVANFREKWNDEGALKWVLIACGLLVVLFIRLGAVSGASMPAGYAGASFDWTIPTLAMVGGLIVLFLLALTVPRGVFYAIPVAAVQFSIFTLLRKGGMNGLTHPSTWWFWWPILWNFLLLAFAWITLPHGKNVALTTFFAELGVSFYVYMPIVSDLRNPPMNWGYPRTWEGFKHAITRGQYEKIAPSDIFDGKMLKQLGYYFTDLRVQYTLIAATLGFLPFTLWSFLWKEAPQTGSAEVKKHSLSRRTAGLASLMASLVLLLGVASLAQRSQPSGTPAMSMVIAAGFLLHFVSLVFGIACLSVGHRFKGVYVGAAIYLVTSALVLASEVSHGEPVLRLDKFLLGDIFLLLLIGGATVVFQQIWGFLQRTWQGHNLSESMTVGISFAGIAAAVCLFLAKGLIHLFSAGAETAGAGVKIASLLLSMLLVGGACAGWFYLRRFAEKKFDFRYDSDNVMQQWLIATAAGFFVMSVVLVVLANVKGDLQDSFIQKVKFISSHGLFALWIGYGLVFGLLIGNRALKWFARRAGWTDGLTKKFRYGLIACGLLAAAIPVYENYNNEWVVFALGGAEQNDHDYGWQFGNYELRGAKAITEELDADEEPLPNPLYPKEMGPGAVFFGGTDPGRFVPTYMIYSANVRPDVFLITQNALADNTYMSVMRDLYGNDIWIPTPEDSARAFQVYVDEVQSGKRPKNAALTVENGRVQVSGALGVMEINGILCDMIFKKNKNIHEFYVEESYVIQWMFPYMTPNGLIMKINSEKCSITPHDRTNDMDFWDWYTRRLVKSPMFRRDIPGQKSFSKLRSAIAGLYASRGMRWEAEKAFQEARVLYPVSPEANFRLIQEVLLQQARYDEAIDVLTDYNERDPNNDRGQNFLEFIKKMKNTEATIRTLQEKLTREKTLPFMEMYNLAMAFREIGNVDASARLILQMASTPGLPPNKVCELGILLGDIHKTAEAVAVLDRVYDQMPENLPAEQLWKIVQIYGNIGNLQKVAKPLARFLTLCPTEWMAWLNMAVVYAQNGQQQETQYALQKALEYGKNAAFQHIQENPSLRQIAAPLFRRMQQNAPGGVQLPMGPRR